jgi:hypothetical protein
MKVPVETLDLNSWLAEFDVWITPALGEIQDTERFLQEMESIVDVFEAIGAATNNFANLEDCRPATIAETFAKFTEGKTEEEAKAKFQALAATLFLVTGKSDNNTKCQFPLYLRDVARWQQLPRIKRTRKSATLVFQDIPRVLKAKTYMEIVACLGSEPAQQSRLLQQFISFVLKDESCISQLWAIGHSYFTLKRIQKERDLLTPLVVFQVRGSVSASGGHNPEELLRQRFAEWGLQREVDYNIKDVVLKIEQKTALSVEEVEEVEEAEETKAAIKKTRAYDFVIPFKTPGWTPRIFIQCQFYAGDSGSVSHKNVDQTDTSRAYILSLVPDARFVEYVDGAGYFSSLNGDLKTLLSKPTTASFFQVRSAAIRLRRELQQVGFLVPLELEHGILRSNGTITDVRRVLIEEGYTEGEIERCLEDCIQRNLVTVEEGGRISLTAERRRVARRYFLLDVVARCGEAPAADKSRLSGSLMVPGYGPFYGKKLPNIVSEALCLAPSLREDWSNPEVITGDISWLCDQGLAMSC